MQNKIHFYLLSLVYPLVVYCINDETQPKNNLDTFKQWFTGPLFTPMAITPRKSHPGFEVTIGVKNQYGIYDSNWEIKNGPDLWSIFNYYDLQLGFSSILGVELIGSWVTNFRQNANASHLQDTIARLGFQITNEVPGTWIPDFRILIQEIFPTGKYQNLNPSKKETDLTGLGSFQTGVYLAFQKLFVLNENQKYQMRFSSGYFIPATVPVKGFNAYGGGYDDRSSLSRTLYLYLLLRRV